MGLGPMLGRGRGGAVEIFSCPTLSNVAVETEARFSDVEDGAAVTGVNDKPCDSA